MKRWLILTPLVLLVVGGFRSAGAEEQCGVCHPKPRVAFAASIHAREEVACTSCHGGNPASRDVDTAHRGSFRSLRDRRQLPERCASCHSDMEQMRPYNLPVDQLAIYQTSQHGQALARGDAAVAVCTDCHGVHDIRPPDEPSSPTHPRNIASTCAGCHADAARMEKYDLDSSVVESYRNSVHGRALEEGKSAAPTCTSCHGVHGATPPGVGDIDKVCGACHEQTRLAFMSGPHYQGMLEAGIPECASCHSNHAIQRHDIESMQALCADCHGEDSEQAVLGDKISALVKNANEETRDAEKLVMEGERAALDVEDHLSRVEEARTYLTETQPLIHTVSLEEIDHQTRRARSIAEEVEHELYEKLDRRTAHLGLVIFWFYLLMTLVILYNYRRRLVTKREP
jgi:predicted CXXCH cytochrome family protein